MLDIGRYLSFGGSLGFSSSLTSDRELEIEGRVELSDLIGGAEMSDLVGGEEMSDLIGGVDV